MKPFLILQLRPIDLASDNEYSAFLRFGGLSENEVHRVRMEKDGIPELDLKDYSGILIGGGPSNVSDDEDVKEACQKRFETDLSNLLEKVFKKDFPILGTCYGIGVIVKNRGGEVSKEKYSEGIGAVEIELSEVGRKDELLRGLPSKFMAYVGHKEACQNIPGGATLLAGSSGCPFQMIRFAKNIYATQFHTELDADDVNLRIKIYKNHGYFSPEDTEALKKKIKNYHVIFPGRILKNFVQKYKQSY
jgi:GMP synthase (glutamine-hydrolysing)